MDTAGSVSSNRSDRIADRHTDRQTEGRTDRRKDGQISKLSAIDERTDEGKSKDTERRRRDGKVKDAVETPRDPEPELTLKSWREEVDTNDDDDDDDDNFHSTAYKSPFRGMRSTEDELYGQYGEQYGEDAEIDEEGQLDVCVYDDEDDDSVSLKAR